LDKYLKNCVENKIISATEELVSFLKKKPQESWTKDQLMVVLISFLFLLLFWIMIDFTSFLLAIILFLTIASLTKPNIASFHEFLRLKIAQNTSSWWMKNIYAPLAVTVISSNSILMQKDYLICTIILVDVDNKRILFIGMFNNWLPLSLSRD